MPAIMNAEILSYGSTAFRHNRFVTSWHRLLQAQRGSTPFTVQNSLPALLTIFAGQVKPDNSKALGECNQRTGRDNVECDFTSLRETVAAHCSALPHPVHPSEAMDACYTFSCVDAKVAYSALRILYEWMVPSTP